MPKLTRISFQLEKTILSAFTKQAEECLMTKSKLLLQWLQDAKEVHLIKQDRQTQMTQFQFRLPVRLAKKLTKTAQDLEISRSALLRSIIKANLLSSQKKSNETDLLLITKTYPQLMGYLEIAESKGEISSIEAKLLAIRSNLEVGPIAFKEVQKTLEEVKIMQRRTPKDQSILARLRVAQGESICLTGRLEEGIRILNEAKMIAYGGGDYLLLSDIYYIVALGLHMAGRIDEAIYNYENALEHITIHNEPYRYARIHLHLAMMAMFRMDLKRANHYLFKAGRIINLKETPHYAVILQTVEAYLLCMQGEYQAAIPMLQQSFEAFKAMHSTFGMYATLQTLAKTLLMVGQVNEAKTLFKQLESQEKKLHQPFSQSRSDFFQQLIESSEGKKKAILNMEEAIDMRRDRLNVQMEEYLLGTALYLYGDSSKGLKILRKLSKKGDHELIRTSAKKTIEDKKLYPVSVI